MAINKDITDVWISGGCNIQALGYNTNIDEVH